MRHFPLFSCLACLVALPACGDDDEEARGGSGGEPSSEGSGGSGGDSDASSEPARFEARSDAFVDGAEIDPKYRCVAPSPDVSWTAVADAQSYAIVFRDVTPGISNGFLHWVLYDIPADVTSVPEGVPIGYAPEEPSGAHQAKIWNGTLGFNGPCGGVNSYELTVYALNVPKLEDVSESSAGGDVRNAIVASAIAGDLIAITSRP